MKDKKYRNVKDHCLRTGEYRGAVHSISNLRYNTPKTVHIAFNNGSHYDYSFIKKESGGKFEKQFTCFG